MGNELHTYMITSGATRRTLAILAVVLVLGLSGGPVHAGTADAPDITDPCGAEPVTSADHKLPENDLCAAWFSADVSGDAPVLSATVRTLAPTVDDLRVVSVGWTAGTGQWLLRLDDTAGPRPLSVPPVEVFPGAHPLMLEIECDRVEEECEPGIPMVGCTLSSYERQAFMVLDEGSVTVEGNEITLALDLATLSLDDTEVAGETIRAGETLTDLTAYVATHPTGAVTPTGGTFASWGGIRAGQYRNADVGRGEAYTLPSEPSVG